MKEEPEEKKKEPKIVTYIKIIGGVIAIIAGLIGIIQVFRPLQRPAEARLEIVDFSFQEIDGSNPIIRVKIRNTGGSVAFLKRAELIFEESSVSKHVDNAGTNVILVEYNWLLTSNDLARESSHIELSRKIDKDDVDFLEFTLGFEEIKSKLEATVLMRLHYNVDKEVSARTVRIVIDNSWSRVPILEIPESMDALMSLLESSEKEYEIRQIIQVLTDENYDSAAPQIVEYLQHPDPSIRFAAAKYFSQVRDPRSVSELIILLTVGEAYVADSALSALIFQGEESISEIAKLLNNSDPSIREIGVNALGEINSPNSEILLIEATEDRGVAKIVFGNEILVAASAIRALTNLKSSEVSPRIEKFLNDPNLSIKLAAIDAAQELHISQAIPTIAELLEYPDNRVHNKAHEALIILVGKDYGNSREDWINLDQ